jgi:hypothetical protein
MLSCGGFEAPPPAPDRILGFGFVPPALRRYSASAPQLRVLVLVGVVHPAAGSAGGVGRVRVDRWSFGC